MLEPNVSVIRKCLISTYTPLPEVLRVLYEHIAQTIYGGSRRSYNVKQYYSQAFTCMETNSLDMLMRPKNL